MGVSGLGQRGVNVKQRACHAKIRGAWSPTKCIVTRHLVLQCDCVMGVKVIVGKGGQCSIQIKVKQNARHAKNSRAFEPS